MASSRSNIIAALDVGSSKIACAVAIKEAAGLRILGAATRRAQGLRRGVITDMDAAEAAIRVAVDTAERMAQTEISSVVVSMSGGAPTSHMVGVEIAAPDRPIDDRDIRGVLRQAGARSEPGERTVLHAVPVSFSLDGANGIVDPRGMIGRRLGVDVHIATAASFAQRNLEICISRAMLSTADLVTGAYAAGLGALTEDERNLGATVVDLGAGVTQIGLFQNGALVHVDGVTIGGAHVTNDLAHTLPSSFDGAERLKTTRGRLYVDPRDDEASVPAPPTEEGWTTATHQMPLSLLIGIIRPRMEEILETVRERIESSGRAPVAGRKIVLTGGGSLLADVDRLAHDILDKPVRIARPHHVPGMPEAMHGPAHAALAGCLAFAGRRLETRSRSSAAARPARRVGFARMGRWLKENF